MRIHLGAKHKVVGVFFLLISFALIKMATENQVITDQANGLEKNNHSSRLKIKVKRRRTIDCSPYGAIRDERKLSILKDKNSCNRSKLPTRKSNPFKARRSSVSAWTPTLDNKENENPKRHSLLYDRLTSEERQREEPSRDKYIEYDKDVDATTTSTSREQVKERKQDGEANCIKNPSITEIPLDWSLKTKLRVTSNLSFAALGKITSVEESKSAVDFTRCTRMNDVTDITPNNSFSREIRRNLYVWTHPSYLTNNAWSTTETKLVQETLKRCLLECNELKSAYHTAWINSFRSVFYLTKTNYCPYFYIVSSSFCCLFRAKGISSDNITCTLSPTTKGFRKALKMEGISFAMPLLKSMDDDSHKIKTQGYSTVTKEISTNADESEDEFLESIGLSKDDFPSVKEKKIQSARSELLLIDNRDESSIVVSGNDTNAFCNFVINSPSFLDPAHKNEMEIPTLIAPVAFEGGSLKAAKLSQGPTKQVINGESKKMFAMDIYGFILPNQFHNICKMLQKEYSEFHMEISAQRSTSIFNIKEQDSSDSSDKDCPLSLCSDTFGLTKKESSYFGQVIINENKRLVAIQHHSDSTSTTFK